MGTRNRGISLVNNSAFDANLREPTRRCGQGTQNEDKRAQHIPLLLWRQEPPLGKSCAFREPLAIPPYGLPVVGITDSALGRILLIVQAGNRLLLRETVEESCDAGLVAVTGLREADFSAMLGRRPRRRH